ncbi:GNAT family N-acetyltransferase [Pantoea ananatis]|uniref:GNAT family N-acetyltransferase n=2 Tax=Pantoea ananas TaxID=553 RepID=UPI000CF49E16|nr:GNAT family N-acetyltransferase [Pantoea ananatis]PQK71585.1 hypothetical protein CG427_17245 [Pantoea ananatis]
MLFPTLLRVLCIMRNQHFHLVEVNESDWELLKKVRLSALKDSPLAFSATLNDALKYTEFEWRLRASGIHSNYFLAVQGVEPIGIVGGRLDSLDEYEVISMWVHSDYRGQGVSDLLMKKLKNFAIEKGYKRLKLSISTYNFKVINFYLKHDFRLVDPVYDEVDLECESIKMSWVRGK